MAFLKRVYALGALRSLLPTDVIEATERLTVLIDPEAMAASREIQRDWQAALQALRTDADAPMPEVSG